MNEAKPAIPPVIVTVLTILPAFCAIAAFAYMFGWGIVEALTAKQKPVYVPRTREWIRPISEVSGSL